MVSSDEPHHYEHFFSIYKEIFHNFNLEKHSHIKGEHFNTEFFHFDLQGNPTTIYTTNKIEKMFLHTPTNKDMGVCELSDFLFYRLPEEIVSHYEKDYNVLRKSPMNLELIFSFCLNNEINHLFEENLKEMIPITNLKLKNNTKYYFIVEFEMFFDNSKRKFEAFYERKKNATHLIYCYEDGKTIEPSFYPTLLFQIKEEFSKKQIAFPLPESENYQEKALNSFLNHYLLDSYRKTNDYKIRSVFQTI